MNPLLIRMRGMMRAQQGGLPYDAEIEYLEGTGTQWIDTGIKPDNTTIIEIIYQDFLGISGVMFGSRVAANNAMYAFGSHAATTVRADCMNKTYTFNNGLGSHTVTLSNASCKIDGANIAIFNPLFTGNNFNIFVFALNNGGSPVNMLNPVKIVSVSIRNTYYSIYLIPVRVGTTGYMYDRVSGQLFGNSGTGDFVLGPDIQ